MSRIVGADDAVRPWQLPRQAPDCQKTCSVTSIGGKDTIDWQGQTRLTACLSGAFCSFRLGLRQQACGSKTKNHSKIHRWQVRSSFAGAEMCPDKKRPAENTCRIVKGLDAVWAHFCPSKPCLPLSIDGKVIIPHFPAGYNGFVEGHAGALFRGRKKTFGEKEDFSKFFGIVYCTKIGLPERGGGREAPHAVQRSVFG